MTITPAENVSSDAISITTPKIQRLALVAGEGSLPFHVVNNAQAQGIEVVPFMVGKDNPPLRKLCGHAGHRITPGLMRKTIALVQQEQLTHLVFAGKVDKWILLRDPRLDDLAMNALKQLRRLNDDAVMLWIIEQFAEHAITVLPQSDYLQSLFLPAGILTKRQPDTMDERDLVYGFEIAKEMGRLDIGQSIVVNQGMILAVEAIEGTDECLRRAGKLGGKKGGVVVKIAKPLQDKRFDIPTVGLRTLRTMKDAGLHMLVAEAGQTLFLEPEAMTEFANRNNIIIVSTDGKMPVATLSIPL